MMLNVSSLHDLIDGGRIMLLINKEEIKKIFTMKDAIEADKLAYSIFSSGGSVSPLRTNIESKGARGNILYMPGYIDRIGVSGLKIVSVFPDNPSIGLVSTPGTILLVDDKTGVVSCILDGTYVTELRTGAATGAAISMLARKGSRIATMIGSGGQAESQFDAILAACDTIEEIRVYSRTRSNREKFSSKMADKYRGRVKVIASPNPDEAIVDADIIVLATTSNEPIINGNLLKKGEIGRASCRERV